MMDDHELKSSVIVSEGLLPFLELVISTFEVDDHSVEERDQWGKFFWVDPAVLVDNGDVVDD